MTESRRTKEGERRRRGERKGREEEEEEREKKKERRKKEEKKKKEKKKERKRKRRRRKKKEKKKEERKKKEYVMWFDGKKIIFLKVQGFRCGGANRVEVFFENSNETRNERILRFFEEILQDIQTTSF